MLEFFPWTIGGVILDIVQRATSRAKGTSAEKDLHVLPGASGLRRKQQVNSEGGDASARVKGCPAGTSGKLMKVSTQEKASSHHQAGPESTEPTR